jgi:glycine cleavage system H protein
MSEMPDDLLYTKNHEWVRVDDDDSITVGITDHAQELLGDLVFVECPEVGRNLKTEEACAVVESVKAASDVYAPVAGQVIDINGELADSPENINQDPYEAGWMFRLQVDDISALDDLLDAQAYSEQLQAEE